MTSSHTPRVTIQSNAVSLIISLFKNGWKRISKKGQIALILFITVEIIAVALDGTGLLLISRASITFTGGNQPGNTSGLITPMCWGMGLLVLKGVFTVAITYRTYEILVLEETRIASENYKKLLSKNFDKIRNEPYSSYFDVVQQAPQVLVHTVVLNSISISVAILNLLVIIILIGKLSVSVAVSTLVFFTVLGLVQNIFISKKSHALGEYRTESTANVQNTLSIGHSFSKIFRVMPSQTYEIFLRDQRIHTGYALAKTKFIQLIPRVTLEIGLALGAVIVFIVSRVTGESDHTFQNIILFVIAGFRIIPILSQVQSLVATTLNEIPYVQKEKLILGDSSKNVTTTSRSSGFNSGNIDMVLELSNVSYKYETAQQAALEKLNIRFNRGLIYAITGPPGAGKSTLMDICLNLISPSDGEIIYGGGSPPVIGYVPQSTDLFEGTIINNIAIEWLEDAVNQEKIDDLLLQMSNFSLLNSFIDDSDDATQLSGGQKQIICLLRALYRDPDLLLLDEATSSLDNEAEQYLNQLLQIEKQSRCVVLIAHRLSSIRNSDQVVYMNRGKIICIGTFEEVKSKVPEFEQLVRLGDTN